MAKGVPKLMSLVKSPESSFMTHEANEEMHNKLSRMEDQLNELTDRSIMGNDVVNTQI
jgi:hypothetical protein